MLPQNPCVGCVVTLDSTRSVLSVIRSSTQPALPRMMFCEMTTNVLLVVAIAAATISGGCKRDQPTGGSSPSTASTIRTSLEEGTVRAGVYEIVSLTENTASCDSEGPSILDEETRRFMVTQPHDSAVIFHACKGIDDCKDHLAQLLARKNPCDRIPLMLTEQDGAGNAYGTTTGTGFARKGECKGAEISELSFVHNAGEIRMRETKRKGSYPTSEGRCGTRSASEALAEVPCSTLRVWRMKLVQAL
jgi:hypothetical protein